MKTIRELYDEIMANKELKARFIEAGQAGKVEAFLKEHGCEATMEEVSAFMKEKSEKDAPLSLDELENSAGGTCNKKTWNETVTSIVGIFGIACAGMAIISAAGAGGKHVGQQQATDGRLCS